MQNTDFGEHAPADIGKGDPAKMAIHGSSHVNIDPTVNPPDMTIKPSTTLAPILLTHSTLKPLIQLTYSFLYHCYGYLALIVRKSDIFDSNTGMFCHFRIQFNHCDVTCDYVRKPELKFFNLYPTPSGSRKVKLGCILFLFLLLLTERCEHLFFFR